MSILLHPSEAYPFEDFALYGYCGSRYQIRERKNLGREKEGRGGGGGDDRRGEGGGEGKEEEGEEEEEKEAEE